MCLQAQLVVLSAQIAWSENIESALTSISGGGDMSPMQGVQSNVEATLNVLADTVLMEQPPLRRRKLEHLVKGDSDQLEALILDKLSENCFTLFRLQSWCTSATSQGR